MQTATAAWLTAAQQGQTQQALSGSYEPVWLVELLGVDRWYATRTVQLGGPRLLGDGWTLGAGILLGSQRPAFARDLAADGIAEVSQSLDDQALSVQVSSLNVALLNQEDLVADLAGKILDNTPIRLRLGFLGLGFADYLLIWQGVIDRYEWGQDALRLECLDGSFQRHRDLSVSIGGQYFPGTPLNNRNRHIPILLGALVDVVPIQVAGAASGALAFALSSTATSLDLTEFAAPFPTTGTISIGAETGVTYTRRRQINIVGRTYLRLEGLTRGAPVTHPLATAVTLTSVAYTHLVGYAVSSVDKVRSGGVIVSPGSYTVSLSASGADRPVTTITFTSDSQNLTVDVNAINVLTTKLLENGGFEAGSISGWTLESGGAAVVGTATPLPQEGVYRLELTGELGVFRGLSRTFPTVPGQLYQVFLEYQNADISTVLTNGGFETGTTASWVIKEQDGAVLTVETPGLGDGIYTLRISAGAGRSTYRVEMYQDATVTSGQNYWFSMTQQSTIVSLVTLFAGGGGGQAAASNRIFQQSKVSFKLGTPTSDALYAPETLSASTTGLVGSAISNTPISNSGLVGTGFTASATTVRVTLIIEGISFVEGLGLLAEPPPPALIDAVRIQLANLQDTSIAGVRLGTQASPAAYTDATYEARQVWTSATTTFTAQTDTTLITLRSKYNLTSRSTYFDDVRVIPVLEAGSRIGGENPAQAIRYVIENFVPRLRVDAASFLAAFQSRAAWRFRAILPSPGDSKALLVRMAYQCGCLYREDAEGIACLIPLDTSRATSYGFASSNIVEGSYQAVLEPMDNVYSHFFIWYGAKAGGSTNPSDFAGVVYATPEETTDPLFPGHVAQCRNALRLFGREHRLEVFADFIADLETATLFLRYLVDRHTLRHILHTFETWLDAARLQLGDMVEIADPLVSAPVPVRAELTDITDSQTTALVRLTARGIEQSLWEAEFNYDPITLEDTLWEANFDYTETLAETESWLADFDTDDVIFQRRRRIASRPAIEDEDDL